ncbi:related to cellulose binding protein CEL1 [Cephalotrichum gorgonifer]|uniref:lytic cellulose monooxygenase (C4-dehydrogenating) n=1 Tax=Cephalotrichum gorgonifer TaxID=2041049 RepID=A0AAE8MY80_9PEZI|nr:related to cellulose binding protein CEL1 [Cephalotrichum gorgonifer]
MRFTGFTFGAAAMVHLAAAHYTFSGLLIDDKLVGEEWQYVRRHDRGYMPTFREEAATSDDFRCNKGAGSGADTDVYTVKPGDKVGLRQAFAADGIRHPGPAQVYLSLAPGSVKEYDGSGEWIKVSQDLACKAGLSAKDLQTDGWCVWDENNISFVVPENIPEGEYLVRAEHIALHGAHEGRAEFYYACAQVKVMGSTGTSLPGDKVLIPGVYGVDDEAINFSIWGGKDTYPYLPGPKVAPGGTIRGSADGSSAETATVPVGESGSSENEPPAGESEIPVPTSTKGTAAETTSAAPAPSVPAGEGGSDESVTTSAAPVPSVPVEEGGSDKSVTASTTATKGTETPRPVCNSRNRRRRHSL